MKTDLKEFEEKMNKQISGYENLLSSVRAGRTAFTLTGLTQQTVYVVGAPGGNVASVTILAPSGGCTPPPPPPPTCTGASCGALPPPTCGAGQTISGGECVTRPSITCPAGETRSGNTCVREACRVAAHSTYRVRAGETNTIVVSVRAGGAPVKLARPPNDRRVGRPGQIAPCGRWPLAA